MITHIYMMKTRLIISKLHGSHKESVTNYIYADAKSDLNFPWMYILSFDHPRIREIHDRMHTFL